MRKNIAILIAVMLVVLAAFAIVLKQDPKTSTTTSDSVAPTPEVIVKTVEACDMLPQADADALFGTSAKLANIVLGNSPDTNVTRSACSYALSGANQAQARSATLLLYVGKNDAGKATNKARFADSKPSQAVAVTGYGESAFWDPATGQLEVLKGDYRLVMSYGGANPSSRKLEDAKKLANIAVPKL